VAGWSAANKPGGAEWDTLVGTPASDDEEYGSAESGDGNVFSLQIATSGVPNWFSQHELWIALSVAPYTISSGKSGFGAGVQSTDL
jgi:hypothetical protein